MISLKQKFRFNDRHGIRVKSLAILLGILAVPMSGQHFLFPDSLLDQIQSRSVNIEKAREYYLDQMRRFPESDSLHLKIAGTYLLQSRWLEARYHYRQYLKKHPDHLNAGLMLAFTYEQEAKSDSALMLVEPLALKYKNNIAVQFKAAALSEQISDYNKAMFFYKQWESLDPQSPWPVSCLGRIYENAGKPDSAITVYLLAEERGGTAISAYKLFIHACRHADTSLARLFQENAIKRSVFEISASENRWQPSSMNIFGSLAPETHQTKNTEDLKKILRSVVLNWVPSPASDSLKELILHLLERYPDAPLLLEQLAYVYKEQKNWSQAIHIYERFLSLKPRSSEGLKNLGSIYEHQEQWVKAYHIYQKGLNLDMRSPEFYPLVIRSAGKANQLEALSDRWSRLYQAHHDNPLLKHYLISVYHLLGQNDKAQTLIDHLNK